MKVTIEDFNYREAHYKYADKSYKVVDLIEAAKGLSIFEMPLSGLYIGVNPWGDMDIKSFVYHVKRMNNLDVKHPIILDTEGYVCDGWHRVAKAILEGKETIKAKRLEIMPEPIINEKGN